MQIRVLFHFHMGAMKDDHCYYLGIHQVYRISGYLHSSVLDSYLTMAFHEFFRLSQAGASIPDSQGGDVVLYLGLGLLGVGLVVTMVGLGEKGFRTLEMRMVGPGLVGCGVTLIILRVLWCLLPRPNKEVIEGRRSLLAETDG